MLVLTAPAATEKITMAEKNEHAWPYSCPICGSPADPSHRFLPFCSERCKTIDLAKWARGHYVISRCIEEADLDEV